MREKVWYHSNIHFRENLMSRFLVLIENCKCCCQKAGHTHLISRKYSNYSVQIYQLKMYVKHILYFTRFYLKNFPGHSNYNFEIPSKFSVVAEPKHYYTNKFSLASNVGGNKSKVTVNAGMGRMCNGRLVIPMSTLQRCHHSYSRRPRKVVRGWQASSIYFHRGYNYF